MRTVRATAHDTLDAIAWRHLGRCNGATEQLLQLNRGLCAHPDGLPPGALVVLPDTPAAPAVRAMVQLWD